MITVYDSVPPFTKLTAIPNEQKMYPWNVAACSLHECIYVSDMTSDCIWRVKDLIAKKFIVGIPAGTISVKPNGDILVLQRNEINIYKPDGSKLPCIALGLPDDLTDSSHVVGTPRGTFLVSNWQEGSGHRICDVFPNGEINLSYRGGKENQKSPANFSKPIQLDSDGRLFVMDNDNLRILLLDSKLHVQRIVLSYAEVQHNQHNPSFVSHDNNHSMLHDTFHMSYDQESGNIVFGSAGWVNIYNIRNLPTSIP